MIILSSLTLLLLFALLMIVLRHQHHQGNQAHQLEQFQHTLIRLETLLSEQNKSNTQIESRFLTFQQSIQSMQVTHREKFDANQLQGLKVIQDSLQKGLSHHQQQMATHFTKQVESMNQAITQLNQTTQKQLERIESKVEQKLTEGFEKTTATFTDVVKRLAIIDAAQKEISKLSSNVIDLQEVLTDKRARGAFGEMQLWNLIRDLIPESHVSFQKTLSNGKRADCVLLLPEPTGMMAIDAKFPLENYQKMIASQSNDANYKAYESQFKQDIKKHIDDISSKYIIPPETADSAMMFIPSEALFSEIHSHHSSLVQYAQQKRVWLVSPSTMMAVLTTAASVLKDAATRKQVHLIQQHLVALGKDFGRFRQRMQQLAKHIEQAHQDANQVHITSQKIANRFDKIEQVELPENQESTPVALEEN